MTALSPGVNVSDETIRLLRNVVPDTTRSGVTTGTGYQPYELEAPAKTLVPVITPVRNLIPRRPGMGAPICHWKSTVAFDTARSRGWTAEGGSPATVTPQVVDLSQPYRTMSLQNNVTFDAQWTGRGLEGDVRAKQTGFLLYQLMMREEYNLLCGSQYLMPPAAPLLTQTAATGGHYADSTLYWVQVTANNAQGESLPSTFASFTTPANSGGNTGNLQITIFTVPDATFYNIYQGTGATPPANGAMWQQTLISGITHAPQPAFNAVITLSGGGSTVSGAEQVGPTLVIPNTAALVTSGTNPVTTATAKAFVDGSGNIESFDGIISQALLNATTNNGLTLGAQVVQPSSAGGIFALSDINLMLLNMYSQAAGDPDYLVMHPLNSVKLTNLSIAAGQTRYVVEANQPEQSGRLVANYRVTHFLNEATGKEIPIIVDRYCPADTIVALPMTIPFPTNDIGSALEIETNREYWGIDFAITASAYPFAVYCMEALKVYFLGGLGILRGILPSI
jgi:hypothetical protein